MVESEEFLVWLHSDQRKIGDYYSDVSKLVCFVGTEEECIKEHERRKSLMRWAGTDAEYVGYPKPNINGLKVGHKEVIYHGRGSIPYDEYSELDEEFV